MSDVDIHRLDDRSRYVASINGREVGYVQYRLRDEAVVLVHTEVADEVEGSGVGSELARHVLDDLRGGDRPVRVECSFLRSWIERHPDYSDLLAADRG